MSAWDQVVVADAWAIICDELVAVIREGGMTAAATAFARATNQAME